MNALYAIVFSACWLSSSAQGTEPTGTSPPATDSTLMPDEPSGDITVPQQIASSKDSQQTSSMASNPTTQAKEPIMVDYQNIPSASKVPLTTESNGSGQTSNTPSLMSTGVQGTTSNQMLNLATPSDEKSPASSTKTSIDTTTGNNPPTAAPPKSDESGAVDTVYTTTSTTSTPRTTAKQTLHTTVRPVTTSTRAPMTNPTTPQDKSSASHTKTSIFLIVIPAIYYLFY